MLRRFLYHWDMEFFLIHKLNWKFCLAQNNLWSEKLIFVSWYRHKISKKPYNWQKAKMKYHWWSKLDSEKDKRLDRSTWNWEKGSTSKSLMKVDLWGLYNICIKIVKFHSSFFLFIFQTFVPQTVYNIVVALIVFTVIIFEFLFYFHILIYEFVFYHYIRITIPHLFHQNAFIASLNWRSALYH
jgi:hypothetical protein